MQNVPFFVIARFDLSNRGNLLNFRLLRFSIENLAMTGESAQDSHTNHKN